MGDPRKKKKKYSTPRHPWQAERLEKEKEILASYSLKNKKEIWRMQSFLSKCTNQAKKLANVRTEQAKIEKEQLINRLFKLGLVKKNADIDDVLSLTVKDVLERRLQTLVYKKNMANTPKQARQFVIHGHVFIDNKKMNVPSYLVDTEEENKISFKNNSPLIGRFGVKEEEKKKTKETESKKKEKKKEDKPKKIENKVKDGE